MMPLYVYVILLAAWIVWFAPFVIAPHRGAKAGQRATVDRRARWGIVLEAIAYSLLWQTRFWTRAPNAWRVATAIVFFVLASLLSWTAVRALGRQWRIDAGLNVDHELIRSGPYRIVRHPVYASMLCVLLGTGALLTPLTLLAAALAIFLVGTEIRVRVEDRLLAAQFGTAFEAYRDRVSAYVPLVR
jgi:protein-S-isoprenylcysteine O-methyltransferase Ste14